MVQFKCYKACLVAIGFHQQQGLLRGDLYSCFKLVPIWLVLSLAISSNWLTRQLDVKNAFLHGVFEEKCFHDSSPSFARPSFPHRVYHLQKALYGLKEVPLAWFSCLSTQLLELGFLGSKSDASLFVCNNGRSPIYIWIYVDDIFVTGPESLLILAYLQSIETIVYL